MSRIELLTDDDWAFLRNRSRKLSGSYWQDLLQDALLTAYQLEMFGKWHNGSARAFICGVINRLWMNHCTVWFGKGHCSGRRNVLNSYAREQQFLYRNHGKRVHCYDAAV